MDAEKSPEQDAIQTAIVELGHWLPGVRLRAITALVHVGAPAVAPLVKILQTQTSYSKDRRKGAIEALKQIGSPSIVPLATALEDAPKRFVCDAVTILASFNTPASHAVLRKFLDRDVEGFRTRKRKRWLGGLADIPGWFLMIFALGPGHNTTWGKETLFVAVVSFIVVGQIRAIKTNDPCETARREAVESLSKSDDLSFIPTFALLLREMDEVIQCKATDALKKLLPRVKASDNLDLPPHAMDALLRELGKFDYRFTVTILRALEQIGDERALPVVEGIAQGKGRGIVEVVRRAAEACLPALRERAKQTTLAHTLLRPSAAPDDASAILLRPVGPTETPVELLLRPASPDGKAETR